MPEINIAPLRKAIRWETSYPQEFILVSDCLRCLKRAAAAARGVSVNSLKNGPNKCRQDDGRLPVE